MECPQSQAWEQPRGRERPGLTRRLRGRDCHTPALPWARGSVARPPALAAETLGSGRPVCAPCSQLHGRASSSLPGCGDEQSPLGRARARAVRCTHLGISLAAVGGAGDSGPAGQRWEVSCWLLDLQMTFLAARCGATKVCFCSLFFCFFTCNITSPRESQSVVPGIAPGTTREHGHAHVWGHPAPIELETGAGPWIRGDYQPPL